MYKYLQGVYWTQKLNTKWLDDLPRTTCLVNLKSRFKSCLIPKSVFLITGAVPFLRHKCFLQKQSGHTLLDYCIFILSFVRLLILHILCPCMCCVFTEDKSGCWVPGLKLQMLWVSAWCWKPYPVLGKSSQLLTAEPSAPAYTVPFKHTYSVYLCILKVLFGLWRWNYFICGKNLLQVLFTQILY